MLIIIISRSALKLGHVGSKIRSLDQQATQVSDLGPLWPSYLLGLGSDLVLRLPDCVEQSFGHLTCKSEVLGSIPGLATYFRFSLR